MVFETTWPQIKETGFADVISRRTPHLKFVRMARAMAHKIPRIDVSFGTTLPRTGHL